MIARNQPPFDALVLALHRPAQAVRVQVAVDAAAHAVLLHQLDHRAAAEIRVERRVMQEADDLLRVLRRAEL